MNNIPELSIIVAAYNSEKYIKYCVNSIINQSYKNWECIIIDDSSTDNTNKLIYLLVKNDKRFIIKRNEVNIGPGNSRNIGIKLARGRFITFIDSDDIWSENKLKDHINFIKNNNFKISHANYGYIDDNGKKLNKEFIVSKKPVGFKNLLKRTEMSCLTTIYDSSQIGKFYMSNDRRRQDFYLWLSILKKGHYSIGFQKTQSYYRLHSNQKPKKINFILDHFLFLKNKIKIDFFSSIFYTLYYVWGALKRYILK